MTSRSNAGFPTSTESVLSAAQFQCLLERERSLADRGTRRFSLLVLRRWAGERAGHREPDALAVLAQQACRRLRSTDLVGRLDTCRLEILLTDTEPAGAHVVALWLEQAGAKLGLDLERTMYVYPCVAEASRDREPDASPREGVHSNGNGRLARHAGDEADTLVAPPSEDEGATNGKPLNGSLNGHATEIPQAHRSKESVVRAGHWPVEDLWPRLGIPTPPWKRCMDVLFSVFALVVLSPLFALIALAIRLDSPGPVIFRQLRAGRGGRPFVFYKFRSMIAEAEHGRAALAARNEQSGPVFKMREDPRTTPVGCWLRRWSIDELPQLWNVLVGDISLVGPRSPTFDEVQKYERWQRRRLCVTGGITCTWQVSGRSEIPFLEWMRLDMRYVACPNLWLDLRLLALTLPAVVSGRGAC